MTLGYHIWSNLVHSPVMNEKRLMLIVLCALEDVVFVQDPGDFFNLFSVLIVFFHCCNTVVLGDWRRIWPTEKSCTNVFHNSALTLLVGRQEGHPACKNRVVGYWHGYLSGARCRLAYGPADATATHCLLLQ